MTSYKIVEEVEDTDELLPIYYREDTIFKLNETSLTFNKEGFYSYLKATIAFEELSNVIHDNITSLKSVGCDTISTEDYAKAYKIIECEFPDEAIIMVEGEVVRTKTIKPLIVIGGQTYEELQKSITS